MCTLYRSGKTLNEIGITYGITRERVRQLIKPYGLTRTFGGAHVRGVTEKIAQIRDHGERLRDKDEGRYQRWLRCSKDAFIDLTGMTWKWTDNNSKNPAYAYVQQARNAQRRAIEWRLTFPQWWKIWQDSGKWLQRGRGEGYCMARHGDSGAYEPENVYICTIGENFSHSYLIHPWVERFSGIHGIQKLERDEMGLSALERRVFELRNAGFRNATVATHIGIKANYAASLWYSARKILGHHVVNAT